jgi:MFS transporter, YNFM family, putative membrane transport protein
LPRKEREVIFLVALAAFISGISLRCVEPMLPKLATEFGTTISAAASIVTTFALAYAGAVLLQGPLGDRYGKVRVVTFAIALTGIASLACALAWDVPSLAAARLAMGIFASASVPLGIAYIGDVVVPAERQAVIANFIGGSVLGQTLGPLFGGAFTDVLGWRASFVALGALFVAVSLILYVRTGRAWPAAGPGAFSPLAVYRSILPRRPVQWLAATGMAETVFFFGAFVFLGAFLKERFDISYTLIGLVLAGYGVGGLVYAGLARRLIAALGEHGLVATGGVLGAVLFTLVVLAPAWPWTIACTVGLGIAFYMLHNTVQMKATEAAPDARGATVALYASCWAMGQATGVAAMGAAVALVGFAPAIVAFGIAFALVGIWLRGNLDRLKP